MARLSVTRSLEFAILAALVAGQSCKRGNEAPSGPMAASLIFDNSSPEAREALATPVDYRLTDANYTQWEQAQNNLDALPRSALRPASPGGGSAIDRAVARLESSPRARREQLHAIRYRGAERCGRQPSNGKRRFRTRSPDANTARFGERARETRFSVTRKQSANEAE